MQIFLLQFQLYRDLKLNKILKKVKSKIAREANSKFKQENTQILLVRNGKPHTIFDQKISNT